MEKKINELVFVLDRSGSMNGLESDTIGGFNSMLKKQKKVDGEAYITTVLFDDKYEVLHDHIAMKHIRNLNEEDYYTRGCTALYDAIGKTIDKMDGIVRQQPSSKVLFVIITDGLENASRSYSRNDVKGAINARTEKGWEFVFLGANIDAETEAEKIGIARARAARYHNDSQGVAHNFQMMGNMTAEFMKNSKVDEEALEQIRADYRKRSER